jgi:hypothetical protein
MTVDVPTLDETFSAPANRVTVEGTADALRSNGFVVYVVDTAADARQLLGELLPRDRAIFTAQSETLRRAGIADDIDKSGEFVSVRAQAEPPGDVWDVVRLGATPEIVVGSVHALTGDGQVLVASASGSQLAPYASGAKWVYWVVGAQKLVPDLTTGLRRIHTYSLPREARRLRELNGQSSIVGRILIVEREVFPERTTVVIVREEIGF